MYQYFSEISRAGWRRKYNTIFRCPAFVEVVATLLIGRSTLVNVDLHRHLERCEAEGLPADHREQMVRTFGLEFDRVSLNVKMAELSANAARSTLRRLLISAASFEMRIGAAFLIAFAASAQPNPCDPDLSAPAGNPYGYQLRGNRCEGVYAQPVASSALVLASFTSEFEDFDAPQQDLVVRWNAPDRREVRIRARTLDRRLHYRMDAIRGAGSTMLPWPVGLLHSLEIRRGNLGVLAWIPAASSPTGKDLYLPARVTQGSPAPAGRTLRFAVLPGVELSEVYLSLAPATQDGRAGAMIRDGQPLRYGYYPADRGIEVGIPTPDKAGVYYLELAATLRSGGSVTLPVWFYNNP